MRIGINARLLLPGPLEGVARFAHETISRMVKSNPEDEFILFFDRKVSSEFIYGENVLPVVLNPAARHPVLWYLWFNILLPRACKKHKVDLFYSPEFFSLNDPRIPSILIVHDLAYLHYPSHQKWLDVKYSQKYVSSYIKAAAKIGCVSKATRSDLITQFPVDIDHTFLSPNAVSRSLSPVSKNTKISIQEKISGGKPYFIILGSIHPRKNIERIIKAYEIYRNENPKALEQLVIVGRPAWKAEEVVNRIRTSSFGTSIFLLGQLKSIDQVLASAEGLLYVSLWEGFGIPILEAFSVKVPVITSNTSSMPEIAKNAAIMVNPHDEKDIARGMRELTNFSLKSKLIAEGLKRVKDFSWEATALTIYKELSTLYNK